MKRNLLTAFLLFFLFPLTALASGNEVLTSLFIDVVLFFLMVAAIIRAKINWMRKLILFAGYVIAVFLLFYFIDQVSFRENQTVINIASALFPPAVVYLTYLLIEPKFK